MPNRFRFSIGHAMVVIAVSAIIFGMMSALKRENYAYLSIGLAITHFTVLVVLIYNVRLSPWMWAVIIGWGGPSVLSILESTILWSILIEPYGLDFLSLSVGQHLFFLLLLGIGFAFTFRDIRRKLKAAEAIINGAKAGEHAQELPE